MPTYYFAREYHRVLRVQTHAQLSPLLRRAWEHSAAVRLIRPIVYTIPATVQTYLIALPRYTVISRGTRLVYRVVVVDDDDD